MQRDSWDEWHGDDPAPLTWKERAGLASAVLALLLVAVVVPLLHGY